MLPKLNRVIWLSEISDEDYSLPDQKIAHILKLLKLGHPTTDGFVITPKAFLEFLEENNLKTKIKHLLETVNFDDLDSVLRVSKHIKKHIIEGILSEDLIKEVKDAYRKFSGVLSDSSVTIHFPGKVLKEKETKGDASLLQKIKEAWALAFDHQDLNHRHKNSLNHFEINPILVIRKVK